MTGMFQDLMTGLDEVDAFLSGQRAGYKVTLPEEVDVKRIRKNLKMTQARPLEMIAAPGQTTVSEVYELLCDKGHLSPPEASARAFLTVIAKNPVAVISALHSGQPNPATRKHSPAIGRRKKTA